MTDLSWLDTKRLCVRAVLMLFQDKPDDSLPQARAGPQQLQHPQLLTQLDAQVNGARH